MNRANSAARRSMPPRLLVGMGLGAWVCLQACAIGSPGGPGGPSPDVAVEAAANQALDDGVAFLAEGRPADAISSFMRIPDAASAELRARALPSIREATDLLSDDEVAAAVASAPTGVRLQTPLLARLSVLRAREGATGEARTLAERILAFGAEEPEAEVARDILAGGRRAEGIELSRIGAILPEEATTALRDYGAAIRDGVNLALAFSEGVELELDVFDDAGVAAAATAGISALTSEGAFGVIGPLSDEGLALAAQARSTSVPLISPTARVLPAGVRGVYSLSAVDAGDAELLGAYAAAQGFQPVVLVYPADADGIFEADAFRTALVSNGGTAPLEIRLDPDTAFFRDPIEEIGRIRPQAIALLLGEAQVRAFAQQSTFFGLDSLQAQRLGGAAWGNESVVSELAQRHTEGVIAAVPESPLGQGDAYNEFVLRYEDTFQRGLSSDAPALGYDAALMLLEAVARAGTDPGDPISVFERIDGLAGATGILSVRDGRIVRRHHLVQIRNRTLVPVGG